MGTVRSNITKKALNLNINNKIYGTFAEIGAGQEVARNFFQAGNASKMIAKSISAYDMTVSDAIYGHSGRYVCKDRLLHMLDLEFALVKGRLSKKRGEDTCFFVFADTVAGKTTKNEFCHGWLGIRFQTKPGGTPNDLLLHVRMLDRRRLEQQDALGIIGVNVVDAAFNHLDNPENIISAITDELDNTRVEIDMIEITGPDVQHIDNRLLSLGLVKNDLTSAVLFSKDGKVLQPSDELWQKPVFVQRGTFRPVTNINVDIQEAGLKRFIAENSVKDGKPPYVFMEMTTQNLETSGEIDKEDFLHRVSTLTELGYNVLISDCFRFSQLKIFLRKHTDKPIGMVVGGSFLKVLFQDAHYDDLPGGILEGMGRLFDENTKVYVYPYLTSKESITAKSFTPPDKFMHLYKHLLESGKIVDIEASSTAEASIDSQNVRELVIQGKDGWEELVPDKAMRLIKDKGYFGYKG